jgi:hypothetical protein
MFPSAFSILSHRLDDVSPPAIPALGRASSGTPAQGKTARPPGVSCLAAEGCPGRRRRRVPTGRPGECLTRSGAVLTRACGGLPERAEDAPATCPSPLCRGDTHARILLCAFIAVSAQRLRHGGQTPAAWLGGTFRIAEATVAPTEPPLRRNGHDAPTRRRRPRRAHGHR